MEKLCFCLYFLPPYFISSNSKYDFPQCLGSTLNNIDHLSHGRQCAKGHIFAIQFLKKLQMTG
jgi:hypothetical protein